MNLRSVIRGLVLAVFASVLVYAAMALLSDGRAVARALAGFRPSIGALLVALTLVSYTIRALRWGALMRVAGYPISVRDAVYLQFSGQTMSVTPARAGEILKPWLARDVAGMPFASGVGLTFAERVADLLGVCVLALGGVTLIGGNVWVLVAGIALVVTGTALAGSAWFHRVALGFLTRSRRASRFRASAEAVSRTVRSSLALRTLVWSVPASAVAWGLEGVGFWLCLRELGFVSLPAPAAVSVYAVATIAGAFSFLPGGIGLTEASMVGVLAALGMPASAASAATLITRFVTLWFGVALGWIALATRPAVFRRAFSAYEADRLP